MVLRTCLHPECTHGSHRLFCARHTASNELPRISLDNALYKYLDQRTIERLMPYFPPTTDVTQWRKSFYPTLKASQDDRILMSVKGDWYTLIFIDTDYRIHNASTRINEKILSVHIERYRYAALGISGAIYSEGLTQDFNQFFLSPLPVKVRVDYSGIVVLDEHMQLWRINLAQNRIGRVHGITVSDFEVIPGQTSVVSVTPNGDVYYGAELIRQLGGRVLEIIVEPDCNLVRFRLDDTVVSIRFKFQFTLNSQDIIL